MPNEAPRISDEIFAELVDCTPEPEPPKAVPLPEAPDATPVQQARTATIEQTGADPPPAHLLQHPSGRDGTWFATTPAFWSLIPPIIAWQLWYTDSSVVSSDDCAWDRAPREGVQVLMVHHRGGQRTIINGRDEYSLPGEAAVKYGLMLDRATFEAIQTRAMRDSWRPA